jgi:hypothetical protein
MLLVHQRCKWARLFELGSGKEATQATSAAFGWELLLLLSVSPEQEEAGYTFFQPNIHPECMKYDKLMWISI